MTRVRLHSILSAVLPAFALWLAGCQGSAPAAAPGAVAPTELDAHRISFAAPTAWGGEARCTPSGCRLVLVDHEAGQLVLNQFEKRSVKELDRQSLAYHPDSAKWLTDEWVVAAVERDHSLDLFRIENNKLVRGPKIVAGFPPRDVVVLSDEGGQFTLLATPYSGKNVAIAQWSLGATESKVSTTSWCEAPWHPAKVSRAPARQGAGVVVACLDGKKLLYVAAANWTSAPKELARFNVVSRSARPSPSGKWVYVALETGGRNARVNMDTGELQYIKAPLTGAVSVAPISDDMIIWGESNSLFVQRIDGTGAVLETRWLPASGFPTQLQLIDLDGDGERDLLVLNSAGERADVFYGPIWDRAQEKL